MDPTILQIVLDELGWNDMDPDDVEGIRERAEEDVDAFEEVVHSVMDTSSFTLVDERDLAVEEHWNTLGVPLARLAGRTLAVKKKILKIAFRTQARKYHPDKGGKVEYMRMLLEARDAIHYLHFR